MKMLAEITVQSSDPGVFHTISLVQIGNENRINCTCPAGDNGQLCKHVLASMRGDDSFLAPGQESAWKDWQRLFRSSELAVLAADYQQESAKLEKEIAVLQRKAKNEKKAFARKALTQLDDTPDGAAPPGSEVAGGLFD